MTQKIISTCQFYEPRGRILMATTKIFNFDLENDKKIIAQQENEQNKEGKAYVRNFFKYLQENGLVKLD